MKRIELIKINQSLLKVLSINDIKTIDVSYIDVYDDFIELRTQMKYSAVITELSHKYHKSERTISRIVAKLEKELYF